MHIIIEIATRSFFSPDHVDIIFIFTLTSTNHETTSFTMWNRFCDKHFPLQINETNRQIAARFEYKTINADNDSWHSGKQMVAFVRGN